MMKVMDEFQATVHTVFARLRSDMESYLDKLTRRNAIRVWWSGSFRTKHCLRVR